MTRRAVRYCFLVFAVFISACSSLPPSGPPGRSAPLPQYFSLADSDATREIVMMSFSLLDTGYRFGGRNPEAGLDCSGMVSYIVEQISGRRLPHNAAQIAQLTRPIPISALQAGDLVFFNTRNQRHSHMGIYLGDGRFVHAPSSRGRVRVESLDSSYFRSRIDGARSL